MKLKTKIAYTVIAAIVIYWLLRLIAPELQETSLLAGYLVIAIINATHKPRSE